MCVHAGMKPNDKAQKSLQTSPIYMCVCVHADRVKNPKVHTDTNSIFRETSLQCRHYALQTVERCLDHLHCRLCRQHFRHQNNAAW